MNSGLRNRLAKLEAARHVHPVVLYFADEAARGARRIDASTKNFFRIIRAITDEPDLQELGYIRDAVRIEGPDKQLFCLARALAQGPVPDNQQPETETGGTEL
jgi:hypothetical protein